MIVPNNPQRFNITLFTLFRCVDSSSSGARRCNRGPSDSQMCVRNAAMYTRMLFPYFSMTHTARVHVSATSLQVASCREHDASQ